MISLWQKIIFLFKRKEILSDEQQKIVDESSCDKANEILKQEEENLKISQKKLESNLKKIFKNIPVLF